MGSCCCCSAARGGCIASGAGGPVRALGIRWPEKEDPLRRCISAPSLPADFLAVFLAPYEGVLPSQRSCLQGAPARCCHGHPAGSSQARGHEGIGLSRDGGHLSKVPSLESGSEESAAMPMRAIFPPVEVFREEGLRSTPIAPASRAQSPEYEAMNKAIPQDFIKPIYDSGALVLKAVKGRAWSHGDPWPEHFVGAQWQAPFLLPGTTRLRPLHVSITTNAQDATQPAAGLCYRSLPWLRGAAASARSPWRTRTAVSTSCCSWSSPLHARIPCRLACLGTPSTGPPLRAGATPRPIAQDLRESRGIRSGEHRQCAAGCVHLCGPCCLHGERKQLLFGVMSDLWLRGNQGRTSFPSSSPVHAGGGGAQWYGSGGLRGHDDQLIPSPHGLQSDRGQYGERECQR